MRRLVRLSCFLSSVVALIIIEAAPALQAGPKKELLPAFEGTLFTAKMAPLVKARRPVLAILWDPHLPDTATPSKESIERLLFGKRPSVRDWYRENSGGRFRLKRAGVMGWYDADKPADHYWSEGQGTDPEDKDGDGWLNGHVEKWAEAIRKADREFDFAAYDKNKDGHLASDELAILVVIPQNGAFGTVRGVVGREWPEAEPLKVDGVTVSEISEWYTGNPPNFGAPAHELAHLVLGAPDMYFGKHWPYAAGDYSLMDRSYSTGHLDPFLKLKLGWLRYRTVTESRTVSLKDIETTGQALVLYDPQKGPGEYFLIENRWRGASYDGEVPSYGRGIACDGVGVWHIIEDPSLMAKTDPSAGESPDWGRYGIRMIRANGGNPFDETRALFNTAGAVVSDSTAPAHLRWADGSPSGFEVALLTGPGRTVRIKVSVSR